MDLDKESETGLSGVDEATDATFNDNITSNQLPKISGLSQVGNTIRVVITDADGNPVGTPFVTTVANTDVVELEVDGVTQSFAPWSITTELALTDGQYTYTATATDSSGNSAQTSTSVDIDNTAPLAGLDISPDEILTTETQPTFTGPADASGQDVTLVIKNQDGTLAYSVTTRFAEGDIWSIKLPEESKLSDGNYTYTIDSQDLAGNQVLKLPAI